MKKILFALLIFISFASCKKEVTTDYKINFYNTKLGMNIRYSDYESNIGDTLIHANSYSVSFKTWHSVALRASIDGDGKGDNLRIEIYENNKIVIDTSLFSNSLNISYIKK